MAKSRKKVILIGITGQIGAGKSAVAKILGSMGCKVISGDELGREVLANNIRVRKKLTRAFGKDILRSNGSINRSELAKRAFVSETSRRKLNRIVHPPLLAELDRQMRVAKRTHSIVVLDATLLIEWGYHTKMDEVVVVTAPKALRHRRLKIKKLTQSDIAARERLQMTQKQFKAYATKLLLNTDTERKLKEDVTARLKSICSRGVDSHR
jgi:dephospho-CoA kinase